MKCFLQFPLLQSALAALLCSCASPSAPANRTATGEGPQFSAQETLSWVTSHPQPQYPLAARRLRMTGAGIFQMRIQIQTGRVKEVTVRRSTGWEMLDAAAIRTLRLWPFRPGAPPPIKVILPHRQDPFAAEDSLINVPISFSMSDGWGRQGQAVHDTSWPNEQRPAAWESRPEKERDAGGFRRPASRQRLPV